MGVSMFEDEIDEVVVTGAELMHQAKVVTYEVTTDVKAPGGSCSCCGAGPRISEGGDYCLIFRAAICDSDGVFYSMLCDFPDQSGCLTATRDANAARKKTPRDEMAELISEIGGDDLDGMAADMDDFEFLSGL
jgi:hypothetical protein